MSDLSFGRPLWLLLVPLVLALLPLVWLSVRRSALSAAALTRESFAPHGGVSVPLTLALAVALAAVAAAQPRWGERTAALQTGGAQLVAVLDVSRSMGVTDVAPSRLAAARAALAESVRRLSGDRVALVVFAGDARVRFPLTRDLAAAATVVESVEGGTLLLARGTSAASGLDLARELFDGEAGGGRLVLLISDGDDLGADPAASAASAAELAAEGIGVLVAGAGTPSGGVVPVFDPGSGRTTALVDRDGAPVVSRLDEAGLRAIAEAAGGRYLGSDLGSLPAAVRARLAALDQGVYGDATASLPVERFQWFAAAALVLAVLGTAVEWRAVPTWRRPAGVALAAGVALVLAACATAAHNLNEEAREALAVGDVAAAVELLYEARAEAPANGRIALNLAAALHQAGRYDEAARIARLAASNRDVAIAAAAYASLGHHLFALGALDESLEAFGEALLLDSGNDRLRRDYEVVYRILHPDRPAEREAGPPPPSGASPPEGEPPDPAGAPGAATAGVPGGVEGGGEALGVEAVEAQLATLDAQVAELRAEAGELLSAEEALAILDLLDQRSRLAAQLAIRVQWSDASDY